MVRVVCVDDLRDTEREIQCPDGGFTSLRILLERDGFGFTVTRTEIPAGGPQTWRYRHHVEACYCVSGLLTVVDEAGLRQTVAPGDVYMVERGEEHVVRALEPTVLICVFRPPLEGSEVHDPDTRSYAPPSVSPVYGVRRVSIDEVQANDYNPNRVAPPEMELLRTSILEDGFTQPVVTYYDDETGKYIVVDGFHRFLIARDCAEVRQREGATLPVVVIDKDMSDRMASTIRHNRARGSHNVELMSTIVAELVEMGKGDRWICQHIGMSADELLRMKQITGLAALFKSRDFSDSWDVVEEEESLVDGATVELPDEVSCD